MGDQTGIQGNVWNMVCKIGIQSFIHMNVKDNMLKRIRLTASSTRRMVLPIFVTLDVMHKIGQTTVTH